VRSALPVSVVVATIGRPALLRQCLESLAGCRRRADEILVIDQSGGDDTREVVSSFTGAGARHVPLHVRNKPLALNTGLNQARHDIVVMTDDDCTVATSWIEAAWAHMAANPDAILTGRVLPSGEALAVPSTIDEAKPRDYTGTFEYGALYAGNMACNRSLVLGLGGFDTRFPVAEDNDLCYRWLRAGGRLRYEPDLVVCHHAWRTPDELDRQYFSYGRGQGIFYAKHLRRGDLRVARFLARDLYRGARGIAVRLVRRHSEWPDPRRRLLHAVILGLIAGWRTFAPRADGFDPRESVGFRGTSRGPHEGGNGVSP
jgi:GT2 family glycosyltransferase